MDISPSELDDPFDFFLDAHTEETVAVDFELAEMLYRTSIELNPREKETYFCLIDLYKKSDRTSEINRLLDDVIKRFPDDKTALTKAGKRCLERDALVKGMNYLQKALALDPLDPKVKELFVIACYKNAAKYASQGKTAKCRQLLSSALEFKSNTADDLYRGHATLRARWAVF